MAKAPATPAPMTLDRSDGSATLELYRAVLGPVHTDKYLRAFTGFDALGHSGIRWNWSAALLTLNWMLFRRLWLPALAYAGVVAGALLLLFGIARLLFQVPDASLWALAGLGVVLSIVVPGAYGNAWLYAACNKAMTQALVASATLEEACAALRKRSHGRQWLMGLGVGNAVLAAAVGGLAWSWMGAALPGIMAGPVVAANAAAATDVPAASSRSSQGLVQPAALPVPAASVASAAASVAAPAAVAPVAVAPLAVASQAAAPASAPAMAASKAAVAEVPAKPSKAELQALALQAKKEKLEKAKEAKEAKAAKLAQEAKAAKEAKQAAAKPAAKASASTASASASASTTASTPATTGQYLINVGLFADANNARNAYTKLQDAGIPASIKELKASKGPQTRVRAGPFDSEAEADRAAETIRGLRLDAVVIKP